VCFATFEEEIHWKKNGEEVTIPDVPCGNQGKTAETAVFTDRICRTGVSMGPPGYGGNAIGVPSLCWHKIRLGQSTELQKRRRHEESKCVGL
jgi:hypothetical protein